MSDNDYVRNDGDEVVVTAQTTENDKAANKAALFRRTALTALVSAFITFILTVSILFYAVYIPSFKAQNENALVFDSAIQTKTAILKLQIMIRKLQDNYLEKLTDAQIIQAMTSGLPASLDNPYTYYLSAEDYAKNQEAMSGQYVGIGCTVTHTKEGETVILLVIQGSPAEKAGLKPGDMIISVDGKDVQLTENPDEIATKVRGKEGTSVNLKIYRQSTNKTLSFNIIRKTILNQNIRYKMLDASTGYLQIKAFAENVDKDFITAMNELQLKGAKNIVFDLRYDSGGNAQVMLDMLEYLLPENTLLASIKGREDGKPFEIKWETQSEMKVPEKMRYAILLNEYSASASEFFSGCLRDNGKALLIGKKTFGKGSGTKMFELPDGSAVNITTFKYYLPKGESVEGIGLKPDIEIDLSEEYKYTSIELLTTEQDAPLKKAIEVLQEIKP